MNGLATLTPIARTALIVLLALMGLFAVLIFVWQILVIRGRSMRNPDGTVDDWREQKILYGMAVADVFWACPVTFSGIALIAMGSVWGTLLAAAAAFWFIWSNLMTTVTSLRFENPRITLSWIVVYPTGILVGAGYLAWFTVYTGRLIGFGRAG